jgi:hypothetical protein
MSSEEEKEKGPEMNANARKWEKQKREYLTFPAVAALNARPPLLISVHSRSFPAIISSDLQSSRTLHGLVLSPSAR